MSRQIDCVDTSRVPREERFALWSQMLIGLNGALPGERDSFQVHGYGDTPLDGHFEKTRVGDLSVCRFEIGPHRVAQRVVGRRRGLNVLLQVQGASVFEQDGQRIETSPGDCLAGDLSQSRQILSPTGTKHFLILIPWLSALSYGLRPQDMTYHRFSSSSGFGRLSRNLVEMIIENRDAIGTEYEHELADMVMRALQPCLATSAAPVPMGSRERLVARARAFVDDNLRDPNLSPQKIAAALDCSERYLHAAFAEEDRTVSSYIWARRLDLCRRELMRTTKDEKLVTDIAFSFGFNSSSHFSRAYRLRFGVSPSETRRNRPGRPSRS